MPPRPRLIRTDSLHRIITCRKSDDAQRIRLRAEASILIRMGYRADELKITTKPHPHIIPRS